MNTIHKHTTSTYTHTSYTRAPTTARVTIQTENTISITSLTHTYKGRCITNITTDQHTVTTEDIQTNMRHIHASIVSMHLDTRGNSKILHTPPPHISSSEVILPRITRRTLAKLRINRSPFLKSYLHKVDVKTHPSPICPLCNTHTHDTTAPAYAPYYHHCICGQTPPEWPHCWPDGRWSWLVTISGKIGLLPLARVMGVGEQQQQWTMLLECVSS